MEIDKLFDEDWGEVGKQWTGRQVQDFIKGQFKAIITELNSLSSGGNCITLQAEGFLEDNQLTLQVDQNPNFDIAKFIKGEQQVYIHITLDNGKFITAPLNIEVWDIDLENPESGYENANGSITFVSGGVTYKCTEFGIQYPIEMFDNEWVFNLASLSGAVKRVVAQMQAGVWRIDTDKSDVADFAEFYDVLNKMWTAQEAHTLAITLNNGSGWRIFNLTGLYLNGSNFILTGTISTTAANVGDAQLMVSKTSMGFSPGGGVPINSLSSMKSKLDKFPSFSLTLAAEEVAAIVGDSSGNHWESVCPADRKIVVQEIATAQSLALISIQQGKLVIPKDADENLIDEVRILLGDDLFNELATKSIATQELKPQPSIEEQIEMAKKAYYEDKAALLAKDEAVGSSDVEPLKIEKK